MLLYIITLYTHHLLLVSESKLFADDTSIFSIVSDDSSHH